MPIGKFFKALLGTGAPAQPLPSAAIDYKGFSIEAAPINEDGKFRTAGFISGELDGEVKRIHYIRADQNADLQSAIEHSVSKGQQIIDEQGASLLHKTQL